MTADYTLYGADLSLYTGKARAYMRYKNLNWQEVLATADVYRDVILPNVGAPIIPVLQTEDDQVVQDTTDIIDFLEQRHPEGCIYPNTPKQRLAALLLEFFGDEWLLLPAMHYRWNYLEHQREFILQGFGQIAGPDANTEEQIKLGEQLCAPFRGSVEKMGVNEDTKAAVEQTYLALLDQLNEHLTHHPYLLGTRPSIGDFGLMGPLYAHLGRDPYPKALMQKRAPKVYEWVERMNNPEPLSGDFLPNDEVPETLLPILRTQSKEQLPDVLSVIQHNAAWLEQNPDGNLPRFLGEHEFTIGDVSSTRWISSYSQWMFQRPLNFYQSLPQDQRQPIDNWLENIGALTALKTQLTHPIKRKQGQLELVAD
jgi:glutathione S-transferase